MARRRVLGPLRQRTRGPGFRRARANEARGFALPVCSRWYTVAVAVFVRIVHRAGATAEYNNGSDELLHGTTSSEGPARSTAELAVVGVVVGTKAHLSAIPRRSPVSQSWLHRRCAHRGGRERRRLLFRPGALFTPEGTAKYISLHLSYRRPGVQPPPVRLSSTLAPAKY